MEIKEYGELLGKIKWHKSKNKFLELFPLQFADSLKICRHNIVYLFNETGAGKTITAGMSVLNYYDLSANTEIINVLVITTKSAQENFKNDWKHVLNFESHNNIKFEVINNDYRNIEKKQKQNIKYNIIIFDEAHLFFSNTESNRYKELCKLRAEKVIFMTATPVRYININIKNYCDVCKKIIEKDVSAVDINDKFLPSHFDLECPVSRYMKDTVERSKGSTDEVYTLKREQPQLIRVVDNKYTDTAEILAKEISQKNRCIVFISTCNGPESHLEKLKKALDDKGLKNYEIFTGANDKNDLKKYDVNQNDFKTENVPDILIGTNVIEAGVNLSAFNRVVHFTVPPVPAVIEQRFGRIDRILNKTGVDNLSSLYKKDIKDLNIGAIFIESNDTTDNICQNINGFINDCIPMFPSRNTILTKNTIESWNGWFENKSIKNIVFYWENDKLYAEGSIRFAGWVDSLNIHIEDKNIICNDESIEFKDLNPYDNALSKILVNVYQDCKTRLNRNEKNSQILKSVDNWNDYWDSVFCINDNKIINSKSLKDTLSELQRNEKYKEFVRAFNTYILDKETPLSDDEFNEIQNLLYRCVQNSGDSNMLYCLFASRETLYDICFNELKALNFHRTQIAKIFLESAKNSCGEIREKYEKFFNFMRKGIRKSPINIPLYVWYVLKNFNHNEQHMQWAIFFDIANIIGRSDGKPYNINSRDISDEDREAYSFIKHGKTIKHDETIPQGEISKEKIIAVFKEFNSFEKTIQWSCKKLKPEDISCIDMMCTYIDFYGAFNQGTRIRKVTKRNIFNCIFNNLEYDSYRCSYYLERSALDKIFNDYYPEKVLSML